MSNKYYIFKKCLFTFATYSGLYEMPKIKSIEEIPNRVIAFSKAISSRDYNQWVHFYEYDYLFERIWNNPQKYLNVLKRFNGVILPDFSVYRNMPLIMQAWNIFRSRAIGNWLQRNGVNVIPNIRYGDSRTYSIVCDGIEKRGIISIGSLGNLKRKTDRDIFLKGLDVIVKKLEPKTIVVYGSAPIKYFGKYVEMGINIINFESETSKKHRSKA